MLLATNTRFVISSTLETKRKSAIQKNRFENRIYKKKQENIERKKTDLEKKYKKHIQQNEKECLKHLQLAERNKKQLKEIQEIPKRFKSSNSEIGT